MRLINATPDELNEVLKINKLNEDNINELELLLKTFAFLNDLDELKKYIVINIKMLYIDNGFDIAQNINEPIFCNLNEVKLFVLDMINKYIQDKKDKILGLEE